MSHLSTPALDPATGATAEVYALIRKAPGNVPNTFGPTALKAVRQADAVLASGASAAFRWLPHSHCE